MSLTLYRKYRPQTFAELVGQNHIKTTLESELISGTLAHAYLFSGPRGLGKTTTARLLAKAVNCLNRKPSESEPCNHCASCDETTNGRTLDVIEIDAASHTGVDNVRENIIEHSRFAPSSRKYKVFIIDEVHMLSMSAFNALLKTLEEPPAHVLFVLATTELRKVPQTIISRCQHFDFRRVPVDAIISRLELLVKKEDKKVDREVLESVAYASQGCLRDAESLLGQILSLGDTHITAMQAELVLPRPQFTAAFELITHINKHELAAALSLVHTLVENGSSAELFVDDVIVLTRQLLFVKVAGVDAARSLPKPIMSELEALSKNVTLQLIQQLIETLIDTRQRMKLVDIASLPLELAIVRLAGDSETDRNLKEGHNPDTSSSGGGAPEIPKKIVSKLPPKNAEKKESAKVQLAERTPAITPSVTLQEVQEKWDEFLVEIKRHNQSVASALKIGQPTGIAKNGEVVIAFQHRFHRERINESRVRDLVERVLAELIGKQLYIQTVIDPSIALPAAAAILEQDDLQSIVHNFSGQLID